MPTPVLEVKSASGLTLYRGKMLNRVPNDMLDWYSASKTCVLMHMTKATNHLDKDLRSVKKPSQPRRTGPPPTLQNAAITDTSVDVRLDLYPGDVFAILRLTEKAPTEGFVCVLVASPVAGVMERPSENIVWLELKIISEDGVRLKPIMSVNVISMAFFHERTAKVQQLTTSTRSLPSKVQLPAVRDMSYSVWLYMAMVFKRISPPGSCDLLEAYTSFL